METSTESSMASLPDDALAAILGRLLPRGLAAARCVCTAWRGIIDGRRLLLQHTLPHYVHGLFINYVDHSKPHFFARPPSPASTATTRGRHIRIDGRFQFIVRRRRNSRYPMTDTRSWYTVLDHCNGVVVLSHDHLGFGGEKSTYLCNPASRRWVHLPSPCSRFAFGRTFLVFDPAAAAATLSLPHYEVLWTQPEPDNPKDMSYKINKKRAGQADSSEVEGEEYNSWRLTEWPPSRWAWLEFSSRTGRWQERVFVREGEAAGTLGDLLLQKKLPYCFCQTWRCSAYWQGALYVHCRGEYVSSMSNNAAARRILDDYSTKENRRRRRRSSLSQHEGWDSDDDNIIDNADADVVGYGVIHFLGFHPYKEVIFLSTYLGVAYHLNTSKTQYFGMVSPKDYTPWGVDESFVYTPCLIGV